MKKVFVLLLALYLAPSGLMAKMCNMDVFTYWDDLGMKVRQSVINTWDKKCEIAMQKGKTRKDQVRIYLHFRYVSQKPLKKLKNETDTLNALIEIADENNAAFKPFKSQPNLMERGKRGIKSREKSRAYTLIGAYCDERAGLYLLEKHSKKGLEIGERYYIARGLSEITTDSAWKKIFKDKLSDRNYVIEGVEIEQLFDGIKKVADKDDSALIDRFGRIGNKVLGEKVDTLRRNIRAREK